MSKKDIIDYVMETPGNTNKRVLGRLIDEVEGVKLPEVTEDDNGNVLTVVEGVWDKAEPSGGSGSDSTPIVRIQQDDTNAYILKSDIDALFGDSDEESAPCFCLVGLEGDPAYYFAIKPGFYRAIHDIDSFGSNNLSIMLNVADFMEADALYFTNKTVSTSGSGTPTTEKYELDAVTKDRYIRDF